MKCDELKPITITDECGYYRVYNKSDVDAAIAELKAEINHKEGVGQRWFERCMEARTENVKLKRALWLARAEIAHKKIDEYWPDYCHNAHSRIALLKWEEVERKCRAKAEKYI